jgi:hypothetical protein
MRVCELCYSLYLFVRRLHVGSFEAIHDIPLDRPSEESRLLRDNRNVLTEPFWTEFMNLDELWSRIMRTRFGFKRIELLVTYIVPINQNPSTRLFVQMLNQRDNT